MLVILRSIERAHATKEFVMLKPLTQSKTKNNNQNYILFQA